MRVRIGAVELGIDVTGQGPALVLLHGFCVDRQMWERNVDAFAATHRVIRVDFRGFGESALSDGKSASASGDGAYALTDLADDAARVLDHLGVPMAAVCGLSMGGYVALAFAARHAARMSALILADTKSVGETADGRARRDQMIEVVRAGGARAFLDLALTGWLAPGASAELKSYVRTLGDRSPTGALTAALAAMRDRPDRTAELARIRCPTLVVVGSEDQLSPVAEARAIASHIAGAEFAELAGAGHLSNIEAPAAFNAAVGEFLAHL